METDKALHELVSDKRRFIENLTLIHDKNRNLVPFKFNKVQDQYWRNHTNRDIICKAGQLGFTSINMADFLIDCITVPGTVSIVVAHEEFITQRLLGKANFFESTIPAELKPKMHHNSAYEMAWKDINSVFYIGSARSFVFGRAERIDNFLASEIAFWDNPERIMRPVMERAKRIVMESTPHGEGTFYHTSFREAEEGNSIWTPHFYPWWWATEYSIPPNSMEALPQDRCFPLKNLSDDELKLMEIHGLVEDQIRWRRRKKSELKEDFLQENPEDSVSCFYTSSETVFDRARLEEMLKDCYPHETTLEGAEVWHLPENGGSYIVGVDPTVGVTNKAGVTVWRVDVPKFLHCATLNVLIDPEPLAAKVDALSNIYNDAFIIPEANNPGLAFLVEMNHIRNNRNVYMRRDPISGLERRQYGWLTTASTKPYMVGVFKQLLSNTITLEADIITHDIRLIQQARNLRYIGNLIESVGEDDILMSAMVAFAARDAVPNIKKGLVGVAGWKPGWGR